MRQLLRGSQILPSHIDCPKVQDPYSVRCVPQVHGAAWESFEHGRQVIERELNSATDNPLVFADGDIVSGGEFPGQILGFVMDYPAIVAAEVALILEPRAFFFFGGDILGRVNSPTTLINNTHTPTLFHSPT